MHVKTITLNRLIDRLRSFFCPKRVQLDRASCCSRAGSDARKRGAGACARVQDACLFSGEHQEAPNSVCLGGWEREIPELLPGNRAHRSSFPRDMVSSCIQYKPNEMYSNSFLTED